ncbi:MAG: type II toxin-antitoxin system PemK/MazF family toxin [Planctomycetota bacterium]
MASYVPERGDFISLTFDPQSGHEQKGRRPALVLSGFAFNKTTGMAVICPITNTDRRNPFHVPLSGRTGLTGFVMVDQLKSLDFRARSAKFIEKAPKEVIEDALGLADAIVFQ